MNDLAYYRTLPYSRRATFERPEQGTSYWLAWIEELPGCKADGESYAEAMHNLDAVFDDYVTAKLEWGATIPEPVRVRTVVRAIVVGNAVAASRAELPPPREAMVQARIIRIEGGRMESLGEDSEPGVLTGT